MGEEADPGEYDLVVAGGHNAGDDGDGERVLEWEIGLPSADDLTPLSQSLVPPELASAFSITPEPVKTILDVHRASQTTLSTLRRQTLPSSSSSAAAAAVNSFAPFSSPGPTSTDDPILLEGAAKEDQPPDDPPAVSMDDADSSALPPENSTDDPSARTLKRPRLVWTPQLHKRFVDVVAHLGIKNAVPKTIMQLMNVEGLTRENVASHLQKYRLYLKRMQGLSNEGPSASDHLFASTPVPQSLHEQLPPPPPPQQPPHVPMPMPYAVPTMIPMPMFGMPHHHGHNGPVGMVPVNNHQGGGAYHGFEAHHHYGAFEERPKDWPGGNNKFGSIVGYPRILPNDK